MGGTCNTRRGGEDVFSSAGKLKEVVGLSTDGRIESKRILRNRVWQCGLDLEQLRSNCNKHSGSCALGSLFWII
jgi:hypothetical protein